MAKVIGAINLQPMPGYPTLKGTEGDQTLVMKYTCSEADLVSLPEFGTVFNDARYSFFNTLTDNILETREIVRDKSGELYEVTCNYKALQGGSGAPNGPIHEEWSYDTQDYDVPIEQHPNYLAGWNYRFIVINGQVEDLVLWSTAKNTKLTEVQAAKYAWIKDGEKVPAGWYEQHSVYKPGVESFRAGMTTVNYVKRCTDLAKLVASAKNDYKKVTPAQTFEKAGEWLRGGSKLKKEGRYWVLTVSYLNSVVWDEDIYDSPST